jgi:hypothetical protein
MVKRNMAVAMAIGLGLIVGGCPSTGTDGPDTAAPPLDLSEVDWGSSDCDPLMPEGCALPWPSNHYLVEDSSRVTGFGLEFGPTSLPANRDGDHVDPTAWQRMDGYGVGSPIVVYFEGLDDSNLPNEKALAESLADTSPVLLFAVKDGSLKRIPCFAELDPMAALDDEAMLFIRPGVVFEPATRYVVALRHLSHRDGTAIPPSIAFQALRAGQTSDTPLAGRQARFDEVFNLLEAAGVDVQALVLAWDFHTASHEALHGTMVHMRDTAFDALGPKGPILTVTEKAPDQPKRPGLEHFTSEESPHIAIQLRGTFEVPHFLSEITVAGGLPGWAFHDPVNFRPQINGTRQAEFRIRIPWSVLDGTPAGIIMHGHGQNGTHSQIQADFYDEIAQKENVVIIGCNMIGMATEDVPTISGIIYDISFFHALTDRIHQGLLEHLLLIRGVRERLPELPELADVNLVMDPEAVYYAGISQGGIYGATLTALSQDFTRAHLGVPGSNYGLLVRRSKNFKEFFMMLHVAYPDFIDKGILLGAIQTLWDQVDPVSYYRHIKKDPLPNTPAHEVLMASATGDYQVALLSNEIIVRSDLGIVLMPDYGRDVPLVEPTPYTHLGSGLVNYSFGNPWPEPGPVPPWDDVGDPHGLGRSLPWHNAQMMHFFRTGEIIDVCGGDGCTPE